MTASGNLGDLFRRAEAWPEDKIQRFCVAQPGCFFRGHQPELDRLAANSLHVHASAVVTHFDHHLIPLVMRLEPDCTVRRLAQPAAFLHRFDAVAHCVPHHVGKRLGDRVQDPLVQIGLLAAQYQFHLAAALPGHIAHHPREAPE